MAESKLFIARQPLTGMWQPFIGDPDSKGRGWMYAPIDSAPDRTRETFRHSMCRNDALDWFAAMRPDLVAHFYKKGIYLLD